MRDVISTSDAIDLPSFHVMLFMYPILCLEWCMLRSCPYGPLSLQCDGKTDTPGSSLMGKDVSDARFDFLLGTSADYFKSYG